MNKCVAALTINFQFHEMKLIEMKRNERYSNELVRTKTLKIFLKKNAFFLILAGKKSFSVKVEKFTIFPDGISWKKIARIHETLTIELQI